VRNPTDCGIYCGNDGTWSIFSGSPMSPNAEWWCGDHDWVSPHSSYWQMFPDCWAECYDTAEEALKKLRELAS
jgi:hypothetical protein